MKYHGLFLFASWILHLFMTETKYSFISHLIMGMIIGFVSAQIETFNE
jgi:hypothetical protein